MQQPNTGSKHHHQQQPPPQQPQYNSQQQYQQPQYNSQQQYQQQPPLQQQSSQGSQLYQQHGNQISKIQRPVLLPTSLHEETFAGVTYHIEGELVPVLTVELPPGAVIYNEHHILLWKHPTVTIRIKKIKDVMKRMIAGIQIVMTEAVGPGMISFSRDGPGHIIPIHLTQGAELHVREHQFLAATNNVEYTFERVKGLSNMLLGGTGFFIDKFRSPAGDGILWLHGFGNVFEKVLAPGETIEVEPGGWLYKDCQVKMETSTTYLSTGILSGLNIFLNKFTGPGRIAIQSMYIHYPEAN